MDVDQSDWARHERQGYPEDLYIGGMGPCTGIAVVSVSSGVAFGAHLVSPHLHESEKLEDMLTAAANELGAAPDLQVTVSGCCEDPSDDWPDIRKHVERRVAAHFPPAVVNIDWPAKGVTSVDMSVEMESGDCHIVHR